MSVTVPTLIVVLPLVVAALVVWGVASKRLCFWVVAKVDSYLQTRIDALHASSGLEDVSDG